MTIDGFAVLLLTIIILGCIGILAFRVFNRIGPFWKQFRWEGSSWKEILEEYGDAIRILKRHWWVPAAAVIIHVVYTMQSIGFFRKLLTDGWETNVARQSHILSWEFYWDLSRFLNSLLGSIKIDWINNILISGYPVLVLYGLYYVVVLINFRNFRQTVFGNSGKSIFFMPLHFIGFLLLCLNIGSVFSNFLPYEFFERPMGMVILSFVEMLLVTPLRAFLIATALLVFGSIVEGNFRFRNIRMNQISFVRLYIFLGLLVLFERNSHWLVNLIEPVTARLSIQATHLGYFIDPAYTMFCILFLFVPVAIVLSDLSVRQAIRKSMNFLLKESADLLKISGIALLPVIILLIINFYTQKPWRLTESLSTALFINRTDKFIIGSLLILSQLMVSMVMFQFWYLRRTGDNCLEGDPVVD